MNFKLVLVLILVMCFNLFGASSEKNNLNEDEKKSKLELINEMSAVSNLPKIEWTGRRISAVILSALIPGSGQTYLGENLKGALFTLGFFGTAVAAVVSQNNFIAREDRIKVLTREYLNQNEFEDAEYYWREIESEVNNRKYDNQRRKIYAYSAAGIWLLNILDIVFLSEDKGKDVFSLNSFGIPAELNLSMQDNYSGVALKFNLP